MPTNDPLKFTRLPAPRHAEDYTATRHHVTYLIWRATDHGGTFGLSINNTNDNPLVRAYWEKRYRGRGIAWLRTKRACETAANEINAMVEKVNARV